MMSKDTDSEDALYEALTIDRQRIPGQRPHYYYRGELHCDWWWRMGHPHMTDIAYFNKNDQFHRIYGPAYISIQFDIEAWYKEGKFHRIDGPAYQHKGSKIWLMDGLLHRLDGPAVDVKGHPKEYWIGGQKWSPKNYKKEIERRKRKGLIK